VTSPIRLFVIRSPCNERSRRGAMDTVFGAVLHGVGPGHRSESLWRRPSPASGCSPPSVKNAFVPMVERRDEYRAGETAEPSVLHAVILLLSSLSQGRHRGVASRN
jgi:hypothetical protein